MKKFLALALCLIFITCFIPTLSLAQGESWTESFTGGLNTDSASGKPYWTLDATTGGTISVGIDPKNASNQCLIINKTTANGTGKVETSLHFDDVVATETSPYVVVEGRVMIKEHGNANLFYMFGGPTSSGTLMASALYGGSFITANDAQVTGKFVSLVTKEQWYKVKYVIDTTKEKSTYDIYVDDKYVLTKNSNYSNAKDNSANKLLFGLNNAENTIYLDDLKVYTTANANTKVSYDFSNDTVTSTGTVAAVTDPDNAYNKVLKLETNGSNAVLSFPAVYATANNSKLVVKARIKNIAQNFQFKIFGENELVNHRLQIQGYGGRLLVDHYKTGYNVDYTNSDIINNYTNKWHDLAIVFETKDATDTVDIYANGTKVLSNLIPRGGFSYIEKLQFITNGGPLYVDDVQIFNPANGEFVTDIELASATKLVIPESETATYPLALNITNDASAAPSNAQVALALKESKAGVSVNGSSLVVSSSATAGTVGLEATVTVGGISYKKEFAVNLVDTYTFTDALFTYDGTTPAESLVAGTLNVNFNAAKNADAAAQPTFIVAVFEGDVLKSAIVKDDVILTSTSQLVSIPVTLDSVSNVTVKLFKWEFSKLVPCDGIESFPR